MWLKPLVIISFWNYDVVLFSGKNKNLICKSLHKKKLLQTKWFKCPLEMLKIEVTDTENCYTGVIS